ncbi:Y-family DNA polymerase [Candidatus Latescibacterota bacterium]
MNVVALVDCNNFYASCEKVFYPKLEGKPIVVLSNNDGCVVSRSGEAKELGVPMGIPVFKIRKLVESGQVHVFSSNYALYGDLSQRVMETLAQFAPELEIYSIDEAFLNLSGFGRCDMTGYGRRIRDTVMRWTGIPISIGIAETKTLAKIASRFAKRSPKADGCLNLTGSPHRNKALALTAVENVWGVGPRYAKFLRAHGIETALDLRNADDWWVRKHMSVMGLRTVRELRGIPSISLELHRPSRQQICVSRSFGRPVETLAEMEQAVAFYTSKAAEKLRREHSVAGTVMVFMRTNSFKDEPQYVRSTMVSLPVPGDCTQELIQYALMGVRSIFREGYRFKKAGVVFTGLCPADQIQTDLFDTRDRDSEQRIMDALDRINACMGAGTLKYAAEGLGKPWKTKFEKRSQRYTTRWSELPMVRAR